MRTASQVVECGLMLANAKSRRTLRWAALLKGKKAHPIRVIYYADIPYRDIAGRGCAYRNIVGNERF